MCIYAYVYIYMCKHVYIYYIHVCTYICKYLYMYMCRYVYMYTCIYVYMYPQMLDNNINSIIPLYLMVKSTKLYHISYHTYNYIYHYLSKPLCPSMNIPWCLCILTHLIQYVYIPVSFPGCPKRVLVPETAHQVTLVSGVDHLRAEIPGGHDAFCWGLTNSNGDLGIDKYSHIYLWNYSIRWGQSHPYRLCIYIST